MVLCAGISLKSLAMEGVAGGDPVPFLGDSLLETFLYDKVSPNVIRCGWLGWKHQLTNYDKGYQPPPSPGLQCSEVVL